MGFFASQPLPLHSPRPREPEWLSPPEHVLPAPFPLQCVLVRTESVAIAVQGGLAYPNGFAFSFLLRRRGDGEEDDPIHGWHAVAPGRDLPSELLRFGVQFADGGKATVLERHGLERSRERPEGPVLVQRGGSGGARGWDVDFWVWPLPPAGPLAFVCEWPAQGIALTRVEVDGAEIREAASRVDALWAAETGA